MDELHIPYIHKKPGGLSDAVDKASYRAELHGQASLQWVYAKDPAHGFEPGVLDPRFDRGEKRVYSLWWLVFPNLTLNFYPRGLSFNPYAPVPGKPQRTLFHWYHLVRDPARYAKRDEVWMMQLVDDEDVDALTQVARGVRSGFAVRGRFGGESEKGPQLLHRQVYEAVFGACVPRLARPRTPLGVVARRRKSLNRPPTCGAFMVAKKKTKVFTAEERAAMRERAQEMKAQAGKADGERDVRAKIAAMPAAERAVAERLHSIIKASGPSLSPRTWYGMPAYAKDGEVLCFFQNPSKFKARYTTLAFSDEAILDEGHMWPTSFAITELTPADEARIAALVKKAVG